MKYYAYNEPVDADCKENMVVVLSEKEILDQYYSYWMERVARSRYPPLGAYDLSFEKCIEEWVIVHWAWETGPNGFLLY